MLDGAARIKDVMKAAAEDGQPAIGITDHGNMYGTLDFYSAAKDAGIKPIIGSEMYMALNSRHERPTRKGKVDDGGGDDTKGEKLYYHIITLAESNEGYKNLMKLSSRAYLEGYFYKPRCLAPWQEIVTRQGVKAIKDIVVGDEVMTHKGRFRRVTKTMQRHHKGDMYGVKLGGRYRQATWMTDEHPVLVRDQSGERKWVTAKDLVAGRPSPTQNVNNWNSWACLPKYADETETVFEVDVTKYVSWKPAPNRPGQFFRESLRKKIGPTYHYTEFPESLELTRDLGYFLGLYIAEGWTAANEVSWAFHRDEQDLVDHCVLMLEKLTGLSASTSTRPDRPDFKGVYVRIHSTVLAEFLRNLCGKGAGNKHLPDFVWESPREFQQGLLDGVFDGDAAIKKDTIIFCQTSENLAWQVRMLRATINDDFAAVTEMRMESEKHNTQYRSCYSPVRERKYKRVLSDEQYVYKPISEVFVRQYDGTVYNIEVDEDHSYVSDFAMHNCDYETLQDHAKGVIATTGCLGGVTLQALLQGDEKSALERAGKLQDIFGKDNLFVEIQDHGLAEQKKTNPMLIELARKLKAPLLATNDSHYVRREDHLAHDALLCVQTGSNLDDPKRFKFDGEEHYLKTAREMRELFKDYPEACDNTLWIAERANVEIEFGKPKLPDFPLPEGFDTQASYLRHLTYEGARMRYCPNGGELPSDVVERLEYELGVIGNMGFDAYFLVVWDLVRFAKDEAGIRVGPGRGCLDGDSQVLTPNGYKAIRDIQIGDEVRTHMREWMPVTNRFRYDVDEPLIRLRAYGDATGISMTKDHKVLVKKADREIVHQRTKGGAVYAETSVDEPVWLPAQEVEVGDLLCVPRPLSSGAAPLVLDLAEYLPSNLPHPVEVTDDLIIERIPTNKSLDHSVRDIARKTGLDRTDIRYTLQGKRQATREKLLPYLAEQGFDTFEEWQWYLDKSAFEMHIIDRYVEISEDFLRLLGLYVSDGWIRRDDVRTVGWADRRSQSTGEIPLLIKRVWQLEAHEGNHLTKDLTQWVIRSYAVRALYQHLASGYIYTPDTKHLPEWSADLNVEQKRALLDGLWEGDGSRTDHWRYTTTSPRLMTQVRDLLWSIGAQAGVSEDNRPARPEHNSRRKSWQVTTRPFFQAPTPQFGAVNDDFVFQRVFKIEELSHAKEVFDIEVARDHSFMTDSYVVHNSAAGCAVAYCLRIVDLDPIKYDLLFERFLNPGRKQMPDIDMDFDDNRRPEMIKYAARMYGWDHVAQIVTFGTIKARAAVRDASRVLGLPYVVGDKIAKLMPPLVMGRDTPLYACLEEHPKYSEGYKMATELRELYASDPEAKKVIDVAGGLEGLRRSDGIHAAAVVITRDPLTDYLPIQRKPGAKENPEDAPIVTQYEMHGVEDLGLLKMDFLGLRNLSVIERALDLIQYSEGLKLGPDAEVPRFDIDNVPLDDEKTLAMLRKGDSIGVFQLEGTAMRALMRALAPTAFEDVAALVALYRPGPMAANMHMDYADRKNGRKPIEYLHKDLAEILGDTQGLMIYQESMMRVAQKFAGFTLEEADNLRKAAGKKIREVMAKQRQKFVDGCEATGYGAQLGNDLFDIIEPFADYAFNKSHSYGYGFVSFQTAYLKAHYPTEYLAALLGSVKDDKDKTAIYLAECRSLGIDVLVPDVNASDSDFIARHPDDAKVGTIPFGLSGVRNVGEGLVEKIVAERDKGGPYVDFYDFCQRVDTSVLNRKALDSLIKAGGFDSLGHTRQGLLSVYESIVDATVARRREHDMGVMSLFGGGGDGGPNFDDAMIPIPDGEFDKTPKLALEKEMLGLYVSDHPLMGAEAALRKHTECTISELREGNAGDMRVVGGIVTNLSKRYTKRGDLMATFLLEDLQYNIECFVFPKTMVEWGSLLANDAIVCIKGRLDDRDDQIKLIVMEVKRPELILDGGPPVRLDIPTHRLTDSLVTDLKKLFVEHPGDSPVYIQIDSRVMRLSDDFNVNSGNGLMGELRVLLGADCFIG